MRNGWVRGSITRRSGVLTVAFSCAVAALGQSQPATQPAETIAVARQRLTRIKSRDRTPSDRTLLAALDFVIAIGSDDSRRIANLVDAVGYQALPLAGDLPEKPDKPLSPAAIEKVLPELPNADLGVLPAQCAAVVPRAALAAEFPAVATWMLPQDLAVVFQPVRGNSLPTWLSQRACVVVRIRGERATIIGGNLLEALLMAAENAAPEAEEK
jgi:hypothetical protein